MTHEDIKNHLYALNGIYMELSEDNPYKKQLGEIIGEFLLFLDACENEEA